jgi:hypothetical protein
MTETTDPRKIAADIALAEANARKAAAEADAAELDAAVPDLPTEIPAGTLTAPDKAPPIATEAAYRALGVATNAIAAKIGSEPIQSLWIVPDGTYLAAIDMHTLLDAQLDRLTKATNDAVKATQAGTAFAPAMTALVASAIPMIASLFSTSRTIKTADVTVTFPAAAALLAHSCHAEGRTVNVWGITDPGAADMTNKLVSLTNARDELEIALVNARASAGPSVAGSASAAEAEAWNSGMEHASNLTFKDAGDFVQKVSEASKAAATDRAEILEKTTIITAGEQLLKVVDEVIVRIEAGGGTMLAQAALGAHLKDSHVLVVQPAYAGGESQYEDVKLKRDRALHMGSCVIDWYLVAPTRELMASGVESAHAAASTKVGIPEVTWLNA